MSYYNQGPPFGPPPTFGAPPPPGFGVPPASYMRRQQIDGMMQKFHGFIKEVRPGEVFELPVKTNSLSLTVVVTLPAGFPEQCAPYVQIRPKLGHVWENEHGYIMHQAFLNWNPSTNLALVVDEIIKELDMFASTRPSPSTPPPRPNAFPAPFMPPETSAIVPPTMGGVDRPIGLVTPPAPKRDPIPEVEALSVSELEELLRDENKLEEFCNKLPVIAQLTSLLKDSRQRNLDTAKSNLEKNNDLTEARERLALKHQELSKVQEEYNNLQRDLSDQGNRYAPRTILIELTESATKSDEQTEEIANEFMDGSKDVKEFIQEFKHARTIYHCRAAKAERLQERLDATGQ